MSRPPLKIDAELAASLRRIGGALEQNRHQYATVVEQIMAATNAEVADRLAAKTEQVTARIVERHQRRIARRLRREERRRDHEGLDAGAGIARGVVYSVVAITCLVYALVHPEFFWMIFVASGFGMSAAASFGRAVRRRRLPNEAGTEAAEPATASPAQAATVNAPPPQEPVAEPPDPKVARIQVLCDKLLAELESGPPIVREVVTEPQATIGGLRRACLETARRERELRDVLAAQDEARLIAERDALAARVSSEPDQIVHERLGQALRALEQQLTNRAELVTAATRLEAENTRILYTLENLHMQLLRARSTDIGAPELGGKLREGLRELGTQIDAVAEALEWASAPAGVQAEAPASGPTDTQAASNMASAQGQVETAERAAAARRAAQAREAQSRGSL
jgi:hypothetical protein